MDQDGPRTVEAYLTALPAERRATLEAVRDVILANLPEGFEEGIAYGIIAWSVPLERFPDTYNGQPLGLAALASQKRHYALYLNAVYGDAETERWFRGRWAATGKRLDMGKSCVRFRRLEDLPLDVIAETFARTSVEGFVERYREVKGSSRASRARSGTPDDPGDWPHDGEALADTVARLALTPEEVKNLRSYLVDGRLETIPARGAKRRVILRFLLERVFTEDRLYPEKEVNQRLALFHPDVAALRRYLVDERYVDRAAGMYARGVPAAPERDAVPDEPS